MKPPTPFSDPTPKLYAYRVECGAYYAIVFASDRTNAIRRAFDLDLFGCKKSELRARRFEFPNGTTPIETKLLKDGYTQCKWHPVVHHSSGECWQCRNNEKNKTDINYTLYPKPFYRRWFSSVKSVRVEQGHRTLSTGPE